MEITSHQIELMQHTLGIRENRREPYRNYFLAGPGHDDNADLNALVSRGLMKIGTAPAFCSVGDVVYRVTDDGKGIAIAALPKPKKPTAYSEYQRADYGHSFADWLGIELPKYETRETGFLTGRYEYRMYRYIPYDYSRYRDVEGEWCSTKKAAKASYKAALRAVGYALNKLKKT